MALDDNLKKWFKRAGLATLGLGTMATTASSQIASDKDTNIDLTINGETYDLDFRAKDYGNTLSREYERTGDYSSAKVAGIQHAKDFITLLYANIDQLKQDDVKALINIAERAAGDAKIHYELIDVRRAAESSMPALKDKLRSLVKSFGATHVAAAMEGQVDQSTYYLEATDLLTPSTQATPPQAQAQPQVQTQPDGGTPPTFDEVLKELELTYYKLYNLEKDQDEQQTNKYDDDIDKLLDEARELEHTARRVHGDPGEANRIINEMDEEVEGNVFGKTQVTAQQQWSQSANPAQQYDDQAYGAVNDQVENAAVVTGVTYLDASEFDDKPVIQIQGRFNIIHNAALDEHFFLPPTTAPVKSMDDDKKGTLTIIYEDGHMVKFNGAYTSTESYDRTKNTNQMADGRRIGRTLGDAAAEKADGKSWGDVGKKYGPKALEQLGQWNIGRVWKNKTERESGRPATLNDLGASMPGLPLGALDLNKDKVQGLNDPFNNLLQEQGFKRPSGIDASSLVYEGSPSPGAHTARVMDERTNGKGAGPQLA